HSAGAARRRSSRRKTCGVLRAISCNASSSTTLVEAAVIAFFLSSVIATLPMVAERSIPTGQPVNGIRCEAMEGNTMHIHQHLAIFDHGKPMRIPDDIGRPLFGGCYYWLHTHTPDGIIHVESPVFRDFTLRDFFAIWAEPLSRTQ